MRRREPVGQGPVFRAANQSPILVMTVGVADPSVEQQVAEKDLLGGCDVRRRGFYRELNAERLEGCEDGVDVVFPDLEPLLHRIAFVTSEEDFVARNETFVFAEKVRRDDASPILPDGQLINGMRNSDQ